MNPEAKKYDAVLIARQSAFKRHHLAGKVERLALVCGGENHGSRPPDYEMPKAAYRPETQLHPEEVYKVIRQSHCGLALSKEEGACWSSGECLLSGIPMVSTPSEGGRDVWYDDYNSIVCEPDPDLVLDAVRKLAEEPRDPFRIRETHIRKAKEHRARFVGALKSLFADRNIGTDAESYFRDTFFHKMREIQVPDFEKVL